jgi:hypothetical protein
MDGHLREASHERRERRSRQFDPESVQQGCHVLTSHSPRVTPTVHITLLVREKIAIQLSSVRHARWLGGGAVGRCRRDDRSSGITESSTVTEFPEKDKASMDFVDLRRSSSLEPVFPC